MLHSPFGASSAGLPGEAIRREWTLIIALGASVIPKSFACTYSAHTFLLSKRRGNGQDDDDHRGKVKVFFGGDFSFCWIPNFFFLFLSLSRPSHTHSGFSLSLFYYQKKKKRTFGSAGWREIIPRVRPLLFWNYVTSFYLFCPFALLLRELRAIYIQLKEARIMHSGFIQQKFLLQEEEDFSHLSSGYSWYARVSQKKKKREKNTPSRLVFGWL